MSGQCVLHHRLEPLGPVRTDLAGAFAGVRQMRPGIGKVKQTRNADEALELGQGKLQIDVRRQTKLTSPSSTDPEWETGPIRRSQQRSGSSPELPSELTLIFIADRLSDELFWINNERLVELEMLGIAIVDFADSMPCDF